MSDTILNLTLKNELSEISRIAEEVEAHGQTRSWPENWISRINLCLDELITNAIDYGYEDTEEHLIHITFIEQNDSLVVVIKDDAIAFDPFIEAPTADTDSEIEDRIIGGLGVHLVTSLMDEYSYERKDDHNYITLVQYMPTE